MNVREFGLDTICGGALPELFDREMADVMGNIADVNTDAEKPRRVTITVDIYPHQDRKQCELKMGVTSKILPVIKVQGSLYIGTKDGKLKGYTTDISQEDLFKQDEQGESTEPAKKPYVVKDSAS